MYSICLRLLVIVYKLGLWVLKLFQKILNYISNKQRMSGFKLKRMDSFRE